MLTTDRKDVLDSVAINQIWVDRDIKQYAILQINPAGVTGPVVLDKVGERTAPWHSIIQQAIIEPQFLTAKRRRLDYPGERLCRIHEDGLFKRALTSEEWELLQKHDPRIVPAQQEFEAKLKNRTKHKIGRK